MSTRHDRSIANLSVDQKVGVRTSDRFWPMRQMCGKDRQGQPITTEIWVDMHSGRGGTEKDTYGSRDGWNHAPPSLESGDPGRAFAYQPPSQAYRERYAKIDWSA